MAKAISSISLHTVGDHVKARELSKLGLQQLSILERQMSFQKLNEGNRVVQPYRGVTIECVICFTIATVTISVEPATKTISKQDSISEIPSWLNEEVDRRYSSPIYFIRIKYEEKDGIAYDLSLETDRLILYEANFNSDLSDNADPDDTLNRYNNFVPGGGSILVDIDLLSDTIFYPLEITAEESTLLIAKAHKLVDGTAPQDIAGDWYSANFEEDPQTIIDSVSSYGISEYYDKLQVASDYGYIDSVTDWVQISQGYGNISYVSFDEWTEEPDLFQGFFHVSENMPDFLDPSYVSPSGESVYNAIFHFGKLDGIQTFTTIANKPLYQGGIRISLESYTTVTEWNNDTDAYWTDSASYWAKPLDIWAETKTGIIGLSTPLEHLSMLDITKTHADSYACSEFSGLLWDKFDNVEAIVYSITEYHKLGINFNENYRAEYEFASETEALIKKLYNLSNIGYLNYFKNMDAESLYQTSSLHIVDDFVDINAEPIVSMKFCSYLWFQEKKGLARVGYCPAKINTYLFAECVCNGTEYGLVEDLPSGPVGSVSLVIYIFAPEWFTQTDDEGNITYWNIYSANRDAGIINPYRCLILEEYMLDVFTDIQTILEANTVIPKTDNLTQTMNYYGYNITNGFL